MQEKSQRRLFYFPALSAGPIAASMKKNQYTPNKLLPYRYYALDYPEQYRIPSFLTTAGHCYKTENYIDAFEFPEGSTVFGDSGGFQIAMGKLEYTHELRERIFRWLESNSTIAANLDIPPKITKSGHFEQCLDMSFDNFKYFEKHQSGKVKFLNVLQGLTEERYSAWYNRVKDFSFNGWAVGVAQFSAALYQIMASTVILMEGGEHRRPDTHWIHFLGVTGTEELVYLAQIQKSFDDIGSHVQISTDSSTPGLQSKYGSWWLPRAWQWKILHIARDKTLPGGKVDFNKGNVFPPTSNLISELLKKEYQDTDIFIDYKSEAYSMLTLNNLSVFKDIHNFVHDLLRNDDYFIEQLLPRNVYTNIKLIDTIIKSDNPRKEFHKALPILTQQRPKTDVAAHDFFI